MNRYDQLAAAGADTDFGRGAGPRDRSRPDHPDPIVSLGDGPYRAAAVGLSDLATKGGLRTDTDARVLDTGGAPIPGLYATGNSMAAVGGTAHHGVGLPMGASMVFAHRAALHMARGAWRSF